LDCKGKKEKVQKKAGSNLKLEKKENKSPTPRKVRWGLGISVRGARWGGEREGASKGQLKNR